jgi:preprotein translocase subunit SecG
MIFIVGILTFLLIVVCAALILLILVQLPKKDSGAGLAFGGGAADALFGAGSGNALTKITKWATVVFVVLTVFLGTLEIKMHNGGQSEFEQGVQQQQMQGSPQMQAPTSSSQSPSSPASAPTTSMPLTTPAPSAPSVPATTSTNGK